MVCFSILNVPKLSILELYSGDYCIGYRTVNVDGTFIDFVIEKRLFTIPDTKDKGIITICKKADKEVE